MLGSILAIFFLPPQKAYWICPPVQAVDHCRFPSGFAYQTKAASLPFVMRTHRSGQGHLSDCTSSTWEKEKKKKISPLKQLMTAFSHANAKKLALCLRVAGSKFVAPIPPHRGKQRDKPSDEATSCNYCKCSPRDLLASTEDDCTCKCT